MIDPNKYGISFSLKQCRNFEIDYTVTLNWLLDKGWRRFRLMSYWNEHEKHPGAYDFAKLDKQIEVIRKRGGVITLCLGARQPRWPENHWPEWAWQASKSERSVALYGFLETVVKRYKNESSIISWQLENEALLAKFGKRPEIDRSRLRQEFKIVKTIDPTRPVIMTTSTSWGIPVRKPIPDIVGFSLYQITYGKRGYSRSFRHAWQDKLRAAVIKLIWKKPAFIHELQLEPWGPANIWEMTEREQSESMSVEQIKQNLTVARKTGLYPVDIWGSEWWYWRHLKGNDDIWSAVEDNFTKIY